MGIAIPNPDRFERFHLVGRKDRPAHTWPSPPTAPDLEPTAWILIGFMEVGNDLTAVYGLLRKEERQEDGLAHRVESITTSALQAHQEKALTKAQVADALKSILAEIA